MSIVQIPINDSQIQSRISFKSAVQILHYHLSPLAEGCCIDALVEYIQLLPCGKCGEVQGDKAANKQ